MSSWKYSPLGETAPEEPIEHTVCSKQKISWARVWRIVYALSLMLAVSTACNIVLYMQIHNNRALLNAHSYGMFHQGMLAVG